MAAIPGCGIHPIRCGLATPCSLLTSLSAGFAVDVCTTRNQDHICTMVLGKLMRLAVREQKGWLRVKIAGAAARHFGTVFGQMGGNGTIMGRPMRVMESLYTRREK